MGNHILPVLIYSRIPNLNISAMNCAYSCNYPVLRWSVRGQILRHHYVPTSSPAHTLGGYYLNEYNTGKKWLRTLCLVRWVKNNSFCQIVQSKNVKIWLKVWLQNFKIVHMIYFINLWFYLLCPLHSTEIWRHIGFTLLICLSIRPPIHL